MRALTSLLSGALFGAGLLLSGMTQPAKVIGFLDFAGNWDPSLAFVMAGALAVYGVLFRLILRRPTPVLASHFQIPPGTPITPRLIAGSAIFGVGWGLAGYCPAPALVGLGARVPGALVVFSGMAVGMLLFAFVERWRTSSNNSSRTQLPDAA